MDSLRLELWIRGERWVSYPSGMRFPSSFRRSYPFRGGGIVSVALYWLNRLGLDRVLLKRVQSEDERMADIALFWPARTRSSSRYYGYRVTGSEVVEYLKFASSDDEWCVLKHEAENSSAVISAGPREFRLPRVVKVDESLRLVAYEPLPGDAQDVKVLGSDISRVEKACRELNGFGWRHGDFAPQNVKVCGNDLWVIDWEEASKSLPGMIDWMTFVVNYRIYCLGKESTAVFSEFLNGHMRDGHVERGIVEAVKSLAERRISSGAELAEFLRGKGEL